MPKSEPIAGRVYVPRLYRVSGRGDLVRSLEDAVRAAGGRLVFSSAWDGPSVLPVYMGIELAGDERIGVICYPFRASQRPIRNRPADEHRVQIRYGGEDSWAGHHGVGRDVAGVDVTVILGVHLEAGIILGLDPTAYDPLPMGISVEFKDAEVSAARKASWHVWERENRPGLRRAMPRSREGLETLVAFTPERLVDYVRFEREASVLGLDPPLRLRLAQVAGKRRESARHALETQFDLAADDILDIIERRFRLGVAMRGGVAEHHLERALGSDPDVDSVSQVDRDGEPDVDLTLRDGRRLLVECKNVSPNRYADGTLKIEVQKTRSQRDDPAGRFYRPDQFDVVAACLFSATGLWEFRYKAAAALHRSPRFPDRLAPVQRVDGSWSETVLGAVGPA